MIRHFQTLAPCVWLLLPQDFAANHWFAPFLPSCTDIVPFGRLKLIAGSKSGGYENFCWYRFVAEHRLGPYSTPAASHRRRGPQGSARNADGPTRATVDGTLLLERLPSEGPPCPA